MELIPAIDLKDGKCVRLYQGDYSRETIFSEDPAGMARHWAELGARWLHLVDLDGAASGEPYHLDTIRAILKAINIPVELGGGIRNMETIETLLNAGVSRIILGTAAAEDPGLVKDASQRYGERIVIGVDARDGYVATRGWQTSTSMTAMDMVQHMAALGAKRFIYTDISRDGTLTEPNFEAFAGLIQGVDLPIIASGGITTLDHLTRLDRLGAEGAIIGRALYTGDIDLKKALAALS